MTRLVLQQVLLGILLLLGCTTRLEALKFSSKGVRGMPSSSASTQLKKVGSATTNTLRILQSNKNDKNKDDGEVVAAVEEDDDKNNQDDDKQYNDKEEETEPPVGAEEEGDKEEETEPPVGAEEEGDTEEETEPPVAAEEEVPQKGGEEEVEPALDDNGNQEPGDEEYPEETTEPGIEAAEEELDGTETSSPEATETMAPASNATPPNGTDALTEVSTVPLAPFVISIEYDLPVEEDPGIEAYLEEEMKKSFSNLVDIELEFSGVTAERRRMSRRLAIQALSYSGFATFNGPPTESETVIQTTQAGILADEEAVAAVIAESLGVMSVTVTSLSVETPATEAPVENTNNGGQLNQMTLIIVIVAACLAGVAFIFVVYKFFCGAEPPPPKAPVKQSSRAAPAPTHLTLAAELAGATGGPEALNATHETDAASLNTDDQVHEEFAQNMEKHSFGSAWQQQQQQEQPVYVQASVMRGTLIEKKQIDPFDAPDDEGKTKLRQMNCELDTLSSDVQTATDKARSLELELELNRLSASVKAAKEKTQRILNEANARNV